MRRGLASALVISGGELLRSGRQARRVTSFAKPRATVTDYLIVGGGTSGCVLANRLSAGGATVRLAEAGRDVPPDAPPDDMTDLYPRSYFNGSYMWPGLVADQSADGSGLMTPFTQARVLGGGSSLMAMIALRGVPDDYDRWAKNGADGWSWEDVLPYFRRLERDRDHAGAAHGSSGPVTVRRHRHDDWPPLCQAIGAAVASRGWPMIDDMNADFRDGYAALPISATLAARVSSASAYLNGTVRARPNLRIDTDTTVERLVFAGERCIGAWVRRGQQRELLRARRVILAAGAIHTPAILMRSGVGPEEHLAGLDIPLVAVRSGVGGNLQNHPVAYLATHLRKEARQSAMLRPQFVCGLRFSSGGPGPDQADVMLLVVSRSSWHGLGHAVGGLGVMLAQPQSRGTVRLAGTPPRTPPEVRFNLLSHAHDRERMVEGLRLAVEIMQDPEVKPLRHELFATGYSRVVRELNRPGWRNTAVTRVLAAALDSSDVARRMIIKYGIAASDIDETRMHSATWLQSTVSRRTFGTYHPSGTCRIGPAEDADSVVDSRCTVHGLEGLSIVDASVMPTIVRGNTNLPVTMIAERAADLLLEMASRSGC